MEDPIGDILPEFCLAGALLEQLFRGLNDWTPGSGRPEEGERWREV